MVAHAHHRRLAVIAVAAAVVITAAVVTTRLVAAGLAGHAFARLVVLGVFGTDRLVTHRRSEEHTSELQSLMRNSYAVFCLKKKNKKQQQHKNTTYTLTKSHNT